MLEKIITYAILGLTLSLTFGYLNRLSRKPIQLDESGKFSLRMSKLYNIVGYTGIVFGLIMIVGPLLFVDEEMDAWSYVLFAFVFVLFTLLGALSILCYRNHMVFYDERLIEVRSPFGKTAGMEWSEIKKIKFIPLTGFIRLTDSRGGRINLHYHLLGMGDFINTLEAKTGLRNKTLRRHFPG